MEMTAIAIGVSVLIMVLNAIVIGLMLIYHGRKKMNTMLVLFGLGVIFTTAGWWPALITFMGIYLPYSVLCRIVSPLIVGLMLINYASTLLSGRLNLIARILSLLLPFPLLVLDLCAGENIVIITYPHGIADVSLCPLGAVLFLVNILFLVINTGIRFILYGWKETVAEAKVKGYMVGAGFTLWSLMSLMDAIFMFPYNIIARVFLIISQYLILIGMLWPEKIVSHYYR